MAVYSSIRNYDHVMKTLSSERTVWEIFATAPPLRFQQYNDLYCGLRRRFSALSIDVSMLLVIIWKYLIAHKYSRNA